VLTTAKCAHFARTQAVECDR